MSRKIHRGQERIDLTDEVISQGSWGLVAQISLNDAIVRQRERFDGYYMLPGQSEIVQLMSASIEKALLNAGKWIVNHSNGMIAVWDGEPAEGSEVSRKG